MKTLFKKEVSSAEPDVYAKRFIEFMKKYILQNPWFKAISFFVLF